MITNYIPNTCKYSVNNLKKVVHIFSESENVIHIDNGEAYVSSGITDFQTIYATSVDFAESTSYDDRFKFEKTVTVTCDGFLKLDSLNEKYYLVLEDENHTMWLVNADFPSFVTYTYTLSEGVDETVFTFNVLSNFPTLKLNAKINNSYECKDYSLANVKELKMNLKENCTIDHVNHIIYDSSNTPYYIVKFNEGTLKLEETYDGFNVTTTIQFNINFDDYKASWHYNLLEYQDNKYVAVTDHLAAGFEMGLIPSYNVQGSSQKGQGDIVTIRLVGTSQKGSEWAENWTEATLIPDYVWLLSEEWACYTPPPPPPPAFEGKYKFTLQDSSVITAECDTNSSITSANTSAYKNTTISAIIGDCVTNIDERAFYECVNLTSVTISDRVTRISTMAFDSCFNLKNVTIPNSVTSIGAQAFYYSGLESVSIPNSITTLTDDVFGRCYNLTGVTIPDSVTSIDARAFSWCGFKSINIPSGVTSINEYAFMRCNSLTSITVDDNNTSYDSRNNCNAIIETSTNNLILGCPITVIPNSITKLGAVAYDNCTGLTSIGPVGSGAQVEIPNSLTTIGDYSFRECSNLTSVTIPNSVTSIGVSAFQDCTNLTSVTIGNGVTSIGNFAFNGCSSLASITCLATTPPTILAPVYTFDNTNNCPIYVPCESLNTYKTASGWSTYASRIQGIPPCGQPTFDGKFKLTLNNSNIVTAACDSTSSITQSEIGARYSGSVVSAVIGDCVTSIDYSAFEECTKLSSCTIGTGVTSIGSYAFSNCNRLTSINIPNGVTSIDGAAFASCTSLTSVTIPNSVTIIGQSAFIGCGLTSCTIGSGVTKINYRTFFNCGDLTSVTVNATTPPYLVNNAFQYTSKNLVIYVPSASVDAYKSAWSGYASRIQSIS